MSRGFWFRIREYLWRMTSGRRAVAAGQAGALRRIGRESLGLRVWRWLTRVLYGFIILSLFLVILFRFVNPPTNLLILGELIRRGEIAQDWRPIGEISVSLRRAVLAAEDARFCEHKGFDVAALRKAVGDWRAGGKLIGASTISQQTAKNVFLWPARSLIRKAFEFWFTALIEIFWSKERILEVYLNVAEFGPGVFGAEAAAASYRTTAAKLNLEQSARLAAVLPAPTRLDPRKLPPERQERVASVIDGARTLAAGGRAACVGE